MSPHISIKPGKPWFMRFDLHQQIWKARYSRLQWAGVLGWNSRTAEKSLIMTLIQEITQHAVCPCRNISFQSWTGGGQPQKPTCPFTSLLTYSCCFCPSAREHCICCIIWCILPGKQSGACRTYWSWAELQWDKETALPSARPALLQLLLPSKTCKVTSLTFGGCSCKFSDLRAVLVYAVVNGERQG